MFRHSRCGARVTLAFWTVDVSVDGGVGSHGIR